MAKKYKQRKNNGNPDAAAHRQRQKGYRLRKLAAGYKEVKLWVLEQNVEAVKAFAQKLEEKRNG